MLKSLHIADFAIIRDLELKLGDGLNLLTGETGAGKSIIVDALGLLLGGRAETGVVRAGARLAVVEGVFAVSESEAIARALAEEQIEWDDELLIRREIQAGGRSRVLINGQSASLALVRRLQPLLAEIYGQGEQQTLQSLRTHTELLDAFADSDDLRRAIASLYMRRREIRQALDDLERDRREREREREFIEFQLAEIERVAPRAGEERELEAERALLVAAEELQTLGVETYLELYEGDRSALALLGAARRRLERVRHLDARLAAVLGDLEQASALIAEAAETIRDRLAALDFSPERLAALEERLASLERLKRRHGVSLDELAEVAAQLRQRRASLIETDRRREDLQRELEAVEARYAEAAAQLSATRRGAAPRLAQRVARELGALAMEHARFQVELRTAEPGAEGYYSAFGADRAEFLLAANPGEPARALGEVASGGELSRLMLALLTVCCAAGSGTLVFDEIDAGIGGRVAEAVGQRLRELATRQQILCVTHQAAIARFADHHFVVAKRVRGGRTEVAVRRLGWEERIGELARLIGAEDIAEAHATARWMLEEARRR